MIDGRKVNVCKLFELSSLGYVMMHIPFQSLTLKLMIDFSHQVVEHIACGSYGNVLKVKFQEDNEVYAMKILKKAQIIAERAVRQCKDEVRNNLGNSSHLITKY